MGSSDLRFLFDRMCPILLRPDDSDEMIDILSSPAVALGALAQATQDLIIVVASVQALEGSASVEDLLLVSRWASHADAGFHEVNEPASTERPAVTRAELTELLDRAAQIGLVFEAPKGVWNVPDHISEQLIRDFELAHPVAELLDDDRGLLLERMTALGLFDEDASASAHEVTDHSDEDLLTRLRGFLCSPARVRALVSTAPPRIRKELHWFAQQGVELEATYWSPLRMEAVQWAAEHLLGREVLLEQAAADGGDFYGVLLAPVALALKGDSWFIPIEHERETTQGVHEASELDELSVGAVAIASAYMNAVGEEDSLVPGTKGYLQGDGFDVLSETGRIWLHDFAVSIGADPLMTERVVEFLLCAGMISAETGGPTDFAYRRWYTADPATRWAVLAVGWLVGRPPEVDVLPFAGSGIDPERAALLAEGYRRITRDIVLLACELEPGHMWYRCCVGSYLLWRYAVLCDVVGMLSDEFFGWAQLGAADLGIFGYGQSSWQAIAIANGLYDVWLTEQNLDVEAMVDLIAPFAEGRLPIATAVQVARTPEGYPASARLAISFDGVAMNEIETGLDFIADRELTGPRSEWIVSEASLIRALTKVQGDVETLFFQLGPLVSNQLKIVLLAEMTRAAGLKKLFEAVAYEAPEGEEPGAEPDTLGESTAADAGCADGTTEPEDPADPDEPVQLRLF